MKKEKRISRFDGLTILKMEKVGRNELCPCGSGKKYKNCHEKEGGLKKKSNRSVIIGAVIIALFIIISVVSMITNRRSSSGPGEAPPGKVWSEEHGHWHDL